MITLIHLLQHVGIPSGVAIVLVIGARKLLKGGLASLGGGRDRDRDRARARDLDRGRRARGYR
jgi:hypothetical protein